VLQTKTTDFDATHLTVRCIHSPPLAVDLGFRVTALEHVEPLRLRPGIRRDVQVGTGGDGDNSLRPHWRHPGVSSLGDRSDEQVAVCNRQRP
jgi:hypothetical protein